MFEEGEELPLFPQPDVEPQRGQTPPLDQARAAAPSHQDEADGSSDKVRRATTESFTPSSSHREESSSLARCRQGLVL